MYVGRERDTDTMSMRCDNAFHSCIIYFAKYMRALASDCFSVCIISGDRRCQLDPVGRGGKEGRDGGRRTARPQ